MRRFPVYIFLFILTGFLSAQSVIWRGQFHSRTETDSLAADNSQSFGFRTRIGAVVKQKSTSVGLEIQGVVNRPDLGMPALTIHQAYVDWHQPYPKNSLLRVGRFEMDLGNRRIFSTNNWTWIGQTFTGMRESVGFVGYGFMDAFSLWQDPPNGVLSVADTNAAFLNGLVFTIPGKQSALWWRDKTSLLILHSRLPGADSARTTYEGAFRFGLWRLGFDGDVAYQNGQVLDTPVKSYFRVWNVSWTFQKFPVVKYIRYGKEVYSGDNPNTETLEGMATPFGDRHLFHGEMDKVGYFPDNSSTGIEESHIYTTLRLLKMDVNLGGYRWASKTGPDRRFRTEWDLSASYPVMESTIMHVGQCRFMDAGSKRQDYFYWAIDVTL